MPEYIEKKELIRQITCDRDNFIGTPDDVQKHDEQCNYAISMIEDASIADVAPVVRCKDCIWYQPVYDDGDDFEVCNYYNREVMGYQFCSESEPYKTAVVLDDEV